jgi:hypothetical protein
MKRDSMALKKDQADDDMQKFDAAEKDQKGNFDLECLLTLEPLVHPHATKKDPRSSSRMSTALQDQNEQVMFSPAPPKVHVYRKELFANLEACKLDKLDSDLPQNRLPGLVRQIILNPLLSALVFEEIVD